MIKELQDFIRRNIKRWEKRYPGNLTGLQVANKRVRGKRTPEYSIVFHVDKKIPENELHRRSRLPNYITLRRKGKKKGRRVTTDVIEASAGKFRSSGAVAPVLPGDVAKEIGAQDFGSIGPVLEKDGTYYVLSNMHVLGVSRLDAGIFNATLGSAQPNIALGDGRIVASFTRGMLHPLLDAAIARIEDATLLQPVIPGFGVPKGARIVGPQDVRPEGYRTHLVGALTRVAGRVVDNAAFKVFETRWGRITFYNLLQVAPNIGRDGDSGGTFIGPDKKVLGILLGSDNAYSYAIPIGAITGTFRVNLFVQ